MLIQIPKVVSFTKKLNIKIPIIQAPMAGGATTPHLVASVSNSGGLGSFGAGYLSPAKIREGIRAIRRLTNHPFAVNLFVPSLFDVEKNKNEIRKMNEQLKIYRERLGIQEQSIAAYQENFDEQVCVLLEEKVPVFSFAFGIPSSEILAKFAANNIVIIGMATTVREAIEIEKNGCDILVAQGSEAGGHRATFLNGYRSSLIGTMALVPQIVDKVKIPVVASGGIMDGRGLVAALALGASGVQMGTAFLTCPESGIHELYKRAILESTEERTVITKIFSGKPARGITNQFIEEMEKYEHEDSLPDYPIQNGLTQDIRKAAALQNKTNFMSMWAGQGTRLSHSKPAEKLISDIKEEADQIIEALQFKK